MRITHPKTTTFIVCLASLLSFIVFSLSSYRYEVVEGDFGPVSIGLAKQEVLQRLQASSDWPAYPEPPRMYSGGFDGYVSNEEVLLAAPAVEMFLSYDVRVRVEFEKDRIARFQFVYPRSVCAECSKQYQLEFHDKVAKLRELQDHVFSGQSRVRFFEEVVKLGFDPGEVIHAAIVELEFNSDLLAPHWRREIDYSGADYAEHLLRNDRWHIYGFKHLAWYSWFDTPHTSSVRFHFRDNKLFWIQHYHSPNELP